MRFGLGVTAAFAAGGLIGTAFGIILTEQKARIKYEEQSASMMRAFEQARRVEYNITVETPAEEEVELEVDPNTDQPAHIDHVQEMIDKGSDPPPAPKQTPGMPTVIHQPAEDNPYHTAVAAQETTPELFVSGGVNDYGVSYIEEEEYEEEDGRVKKQIILMMDEHNPVFMMDGQKINDWDARVGDSIVVDFYKFVPPNTAQVLYVRNHETDIDYEVVRQQP